MSNRQEGGQGWRPGMSQETPTETTVTRVGCGRRDTETKTGALHADMWPTVLRE